MLAGIALCLFFLGVAFAMSAALGVCFRGRLGPQRQHKTSVSGRTVCVVLGSGGHTSEMLRALRCLPDDLLRSHQLHYVVSATDAHSAQLAMRHDQERFGRAATVHTIPRAREVGQSYTSSIRTTLVALMSALRVVYRCKPDAVLVNGPGVCVPVVLAAAFWAALLPWRRSYPSTMYMESFTCVRHLSLTGKLLVPVLCDTVAFHWEPLEGVIAARQRCGERRYIGPSSAACASSSPLTPANARIATGAGAEHAERYAVVTVGSTFFDELVIAGVTPAVCKALHTQFGVRRLYIQYGTTPLELNKLVDIEQVAATGGPADGAATSADPTTQHGKLAGVTIEAFAYRPGLAALLAGAYIVLTHAGAGTILECLEARRLTVVVPNHRLMSDHQLELAEALDTGKFLYCVNPEDIAARLASGTMNGSRLRVFPGMDADALTAALSPMLTVDSAKTD